MEILIGILCFVFVIGLCIGSFLNVVILRTLSEESIVFPASKCPKCQTPLKWWHNIPVFSYIFLRGKCAFCKTHISIQYPIIELFTGIMFTLLFLKFGFDIQTIYAWIVASLLIVMAGTDIKEKVVYNVHTYALIIIGLLFAIYSTVLAHAQFSNTQIEYMTILSNPISNGILGALTGFIIMEILARTGYIFVGSRAFGEGDSWIAAGLGMVFGWQNVIVILIYSVIIQIIMFLPIFVIELIKQKNFKTLFSLVFFALYASAIVMLQNFNLIQSQILLLLSLLILMISGIICCIFIIRGLREKPTDRTYLPFGPAMVIAGFIAMLI